MNDDRATLCSVSPNIVNGIDCGTHNTTNTPYHYSRHHQLLNDNYFYP